VVTENNVVTSPETEIEFEKVGTLLLITPNVNSNGTVTLRMVQESSALAAEKGKIPLVNAAGEIQYFDVDVVESRSVSGTFVAQDGQTVAIGGMVQEEEKDVRSGIPLLMDIPGLGWLFRSTERVKSRNELVVFVTPRVMAGPAEAEAATRAYGEANLRSDELREDAGLEPLEKLGALEATGKEWKGVLGPGERDAHVVERKGTRE
jgi:type II secretory pathway component GspD/PulD (secretin)